MSDENRKTLRSFACRDHLWDLFQQMSAELECEPDYLINEAMRQYARTRNYHTSRPTSPIPSLRRSRPPIPSAPPPPPRVSAPAAAPLGTYADTTRTPPPGHTSGPPPLPGAMPSRAPQRALHVIFNGQKIPITKEEFVIGRGSKTADLPIKDGNISRRHAVIVLRDGVHFIKDLGSTNGIEFAGRRIESKRLDEGDLIQICDYELRFTYR
ncbi:MAG: FHA domain-containing protein [Myxococcota bacterium]